MDQLQLTINPNGDYKITRANLVNSLQHRFPGIRFLGQTRNSKCTISWTNGPTIGQVEAIAFEFVVSPHSTSPKFNQAYGHFSEINYRRMAGNEIYNLVPMARSILLDAGKEKQHQECKFLLSLFSRQSFPPGARLSGIEKSGWMEKQLGRQYRITCETEALSLIQ